MKNFMLILTVELVTHLLSVMLILNASDLIEFMVVEMTYLNLNIIRCAIPMVNIERLMIIFIVSLFFLSFFIQFI